MTEPRFDYTGRAWIAAVGGAAVFLSNPDTYLFALISVPVFLVTYFSLRQRSNRLLLLGSYGCLSLYSFLVGRYCFADHQLTSFGLFAFLFGCGITLLGTLVLYKREQQTTA
jgi:hypothetical protein